MTNHQPDSSLASDHEQSLSNFVGHSRTSTADHLCKFLIQFQGHIDSWSTAKLGFLTKRCLYKK